MSDRLTAAVRELEQACAGLVEIVRVDVGDDGGLALTAACKDGTRWFTRDEGGLVERFPQGDERLALAALLRRGGDWHVLSYRPGRRMVVRAGGRGEPEVLKGHRKARSTRALARQAFAESAMQRGAFRVPRLLRHDVAHETLVFEYVRGAEVALGAESAPQYARLGELLAVFQRQDGSSLEDHGVREELEVLDRWSRKVLQVAEALPAGWAAARARLAQRAVDLPAPERAPSHRDLHDRQVHLDGTEVAVLDFDLLCRADDALDPGNLVAHLRWRALQGEHGASAASVRELEAAFLAGLGRERERGFETQLAFYTASALLRLALVYRLRPRWSSRVGELVALAETVLDEPVLPRAGGA